jgi:hypothetical protein
LAVSLPVSVERRGGKTASLLRGCLSISLVEVPVRSTSPNRDKSLNPFKSVEAIRGYSIREK